MRVEQQISAVLAGASFVAFTQLCTRDNMPGLLSVAWWILAAVIPVLASVATLPLTDDHIQAPAYEMLRTGAFVSSIVGSVLAFACIFSHFYLGSGFLFLAVAVGTYQLQRAAVKRQKKEKEPDEDV